MKIVTKDPRSLAPGLFIMFLSRQGVRDSFKECFERSNSESVLPYLHATDPKEYILCAFDWSFAPKGPRYWSNLNSEWNRVLELFKF